MTLRLRTFGAVYLERDGSPLGGAHSQRRRLALLAYLAAANGAAITREKLIALLWPDSDEASGRHSLSQLLYSVRHDLGASAIVVDSETVRLVATELLSDIQAFDAALKSGAIEEAAELYRGAFLDGFHLDNAPDFNRWVEEERTRSTAACARALERLADQAAKAGNPHREVEWCRRRVLLDPADGRSTLRLMQALAAIGDREGALRVARVYEAMLREDLDVEPDRAVSELVARLREPGAAAPVPNEPIAPSPAPLPPVVPPVAPAPTTPRVDRRQQPPRPARRRVFTWPRAAVLLAGAVLVASIALQFNVGGTSPPNGGPRGATATVVVGHLDGPDSVLALAVREAIRAELANTPGVLLTSDASIRELLSLMRLPTSPPPTAGDLLALATRAGAHAVVTGSVLPVGEGAQIVVEILDPGSGRSLGTFSGRPVDASSLLASVDDIGRSLGAAISHAPRDASIRPLPPVTTASLPALKSYAVARQIASTGDRRNAIAPGERAVTHDSTFVLAHYFLGDLLWFMDEQTHAEAHLTKAMQLLATVPPREQMIIRARYEQLVHDRPDSALAYWDLLHDASPRDPLAHEGRAWALRALGRHEEAAAAADSALQLDPGALVPNTNNMLYSWLAVGDTAAALALGTRLAARNPEANAEARYFAALFRGDLDLALSLADSSSRPSARAHRRHMAHLARGDLRAARRDVDTLLALDEAAFAPNAVLNLGWTTLALGGDSADAVRYARQALDWARRRDLSPPALGRLAERIADLAARAGDVATVRAVQALVKERDRGRSLRTYVLAQRTVDAALAYAQGNYAEAARLAAVARRGVYFSRSLATIVQLEADARRASGEPSIADALERLIATREIVDGHFEVWAVLRSATALRGKRLAQRP